MAIANVAANLALNLHIEAVQTVPPLTVSDPRPIRRVSVTNPAGSGVFGRAINVILCYKKSTEEDSGYIVAGWIKESLGKALSQQPLLGGRFRIREDGDGESEVVANDSGARLLEAKMSMTLQEFFDSKDMKDIEAKLVFWRDIDEQNPQYSPLFYVQVTNFECGGYSIGISCSILLADILFMGNFLQRWAIIHNNLMSKNEANKNPIFYFHNHEKSKSIPTSLITSNQRKNCGQTFIFKCSATENVSLEKESGKKLALLSIEKAEQQVGCKMAPKYSFFSQESLDAIRIETCEKQKIVESKMKMSPGNQLSSASWDELGDIAFHEKNKPTHVSYWIGSMLNDDDNGVLMAFSSSPDKGTPEMNFIFTIPDGKN